MNFDRTKRLAASPVLQFLVVGLLIVAAVGVCTGILSQRAAEEEAVSEAVRVTELLADSVIQPAIPRGLQNGDVGAADRFDDAVRVRLTERSGDLIGDLARVKIWNSESVTVYSDNGRYIGDVYPLDEENLEILEDGGSAAEMSVEREPENRYEDLSEGGLVEVYTQVWSPEGERMLFEVYFPTSSIDARQADVVTAFQRISLGGLLVLLAVATPMLWALNRRVRRGAAERQRLLESAITASESERRRIARDLHDGVVQELAGTAFSVSALARSETDASRREALERSAGSLREGLRGLRSLMVEIHPPDLSVEGLEVALEDLIAPAAGAGVHASLRVDDVAGVPDDVIALVWRVAQEAVRNTVRHAQASELGVSVCREKGTLVLEVSDDGVGFRPGHDGASHSFGLRGLSSLVRDHGGKVEVRSLPGAGTTVRMEVGAR